MIQDIAPHTYHNEYKPVAPDKESHILAYEEGKILMKKDGETMTLPSFGELEGKLTKAQMKLVDAWMEIHKDDLAANWTLLSNGEQFFRIDPLK